MATINFTTRFDVHTTTKVFKFVDTSDYAGQGISLSDVNGCFRIVAPSGITTYNNTDFSNSGCDIQVSVSTGNKTTILCPLATDNFPEKGIYTIYYSVFNKDTNETYTKVYTYNYQYARPTICINQIVDCISPLFSSIDATNYVVNGVTPIRQGGVSILGDYINAIYYPNGSAGQDNPTVGQTTTVTTSLFWNGDTTSEISGTWLYTFPTTTTTQSFEVYDYISGNRTEKVDCVDTCKIYCCIRSLEQRMMNYATTNTVMYEETSDLFTQVMGLVGLVAEAKRCGKSDDISGYLDAIKKLANCTDDCSCGDNTPSQVTGIGGLVNQVVVQSGGEPVAVTAVTVGNTTTYTITLSDTFLANNFVTTVSAGTGITVVDEGIVAGVRNYVVSANMVIERLQAVKATTYTPDARIPSIPMSAHASYIYANTDVVKLTDWHIGTETLSGFDATAGEWTCPQTGYYNLDLRGIITAYPDPTTGGFYEEGDFGNGSFLFACVNKNTGVNPNVIKLFRQYDTSSGFYESFTSGTLTAGVRYVIDRLAIGDDFDNVGYLNNGEIFVATGTTPTTWTHGTVVKEAPTSTSSQVGRTSVINFVEQRFRQYILAGEIMTIKVLNKTQLDYTMQSSNDASVFQSITLTIDKVA